MEYKNDRKYAIYSRKSKFTGKGESIENQIELCKNHIRLHHPEITDNDIIVYEDEGFSGGNTNRPQFKKMMKDVKSKKIKSVVCYRLDRISRNVGDFAKLKDEFDYYDVEFVSIRDDFDTSTPSGRAMMMMVSVFAQLERETTAERIRDNMHELAKTGRWLGGITPTGYKSQKIVQSVTIDGKERTAYKLDIVESESEIIRVIFKKFLETNSLTKTDSYLLVNHIMTKNGREFSRYTIKGILQNPVYMCADEEAWTFFNEQNVEIYSDKSDFDGKHGVIAYNKTNQKPGRATRLNEMSEWIVSVGKHKPIISSHDWIMAQNNLWQNKSKSFHKPKSNVALLSGLLRCANCGDFMRPKLTGRTTKNGDRLYVYMCQTKERSRRKLCGIKDLYGNDLDELVCNKIKEIASDGSEYIEGLKKYDATLSKSKASYEAKLKKLNTQLKKVKEQISNLVQIMASNPNPNIVSHISEQIDELDKQEKQLSEKVENLKSLIASSTHTNEQLANIKELVKSFGKTFDNMNIEQKRMALRSLIRKITWDGENVHIIIFGDREADVEDESIDSETCGSEGGFDEFTVESVSPQCEDGKYYTHITDFFAEKSSNTEHIFGFYHTIYRLNDHFKIMAKREDDNTIILPYYMSTIQFVFTRQIRYTHKFNVEVTDIKQLHTIGERLRFLRYKNNLLQTDVAAVLGIHPSSYINYESENKPQYSNNVLIKLAEFYKVDIEDIMDDYQIFLYRGQGRQIKLLREATGMNRAAFEKELGFPKGILKEWESERQVISRKSYNKLKKSMTDIE